MLKEIGYRNLNGLNVLLPKINHFLSKIEDGFSFIKVNHGFWCLASGCIVTGNNKILKPPGWRAPDMVRIIKHDPRKTVVVSGSEATNINE